MFSDVKKLFNYVLRKLPPGISVPLYHLRLRLQGQIIYSWSGVQEAFAKAERARTVSEDLFLKELRSFYFHFPEVPDVDPRSVQYRSFWAKTYERLSKRTYNVDNERVDFDESRPPYPFFTGSSDMVGLHFIAIGFVIRALGLTPGARILELGAGCGNISIALSQMGCDVTAIEIEPKCVRIIDQRAKQLGTKLTAVHGDFFSIRNQPAESFDAVLFCGAFHHCSDHLALLDEIPRVLKPGGMLALAGETINERFPSPWGLNPNGEAIWQIVKNGWMELAFKESYILETLKMKGWSVCRHDCPSTDGGIVYVAHRC